MADLYDTLGISRGATKAEIRKGYRRSAKRAHPDAGGSVEHFREIQTALAVLSDDSRRAKYDATGKFEEVGPDIEMAQTLEVVSMTIDLALGNLLRRGQEPQFADLIAEMKRATADGKRKKREEIDAYKGASASWDKIVGRFSTKGDVPNYLDQVVRGKITQLASMISTAEQEVERFVNVDKMIDQYVYRRDVQPEGPTTVKFSGDAANLMRLMMRGGQF